MDVRAQRIYEARIAGLTARMRDSGLPAERAAQLIAAFDAEAAARGLSRDANDYWTEIEAVLASAVSSVGRRA